MKKSIGAKTIIYPSPVLIVATYDRVIQKLDQLGYTTVILYASEAEYLAAAETNRFPLRIARIDRMRC